MKKIQTISFLMLFLLSMSSVFSQVKNSIVENPVDYINKRTEVINLAKREKWKEAIIVLKNLTEQYKNDSDLYYILGLSFYQTKQYQNAITALKKTLNLGGTVLDGIPTGG